MCGAELLEVLHAVGDAEGPEQSAAMCAGSTVVSWPLFNALNKTTVIPLIKSFYRNTVILY